MFEGASSPSSLVVPIQLRANTPANTGLGPAAGRSLHHRKGNGAGVESVDVRQSKLTLPTYLPAAPDVNPMFLEKRVYQGSSGCVYPLPFTDRIAEKPVDRAWQAIWLENDYLKVLVLPEIGGRIHAIQDKTTGVDLIYNQPVIKPALVGLAGPWISGGIEFNWPQHHRPATFLPVDTEIEHHPDGAVTVWCSDHDPMLRMKGMHGVCLHPGRAVLELKVRAYNRTPLPQTFLWWANVATRVHEAYQSFFPPDVSYVADHAKRATSAYPLCAGHYYGVDYAKRSHQGVPAAEIPRQFVSPYCSDVTRNPQHGGNPTIRSAQSEVPHLPSPISHLPKYAPNDLSYYANIPVPTSYMCMGTKEDFFGGYDYSTQAGLVHVANHHISPGKKQWTWGNHEFGYAWDRNLTIEDSRGAFGPYIELMAGVYTDNQPDFSFLQPGETKSWSQYWYPIQQIGPAQHANLHAAVSLRVEQGRVKVGVAVTQPYHGAVVKLSHRARVLRQTTLDLSPGRPLIFEVRLPRGASEDGLQVTLCEGAGRELITYAPGSPRDAEVPAAATEPPAPANIDTTDELYLTGLHLEQYRHATRCPSPYWREALRRDPLDARCNNALGAWHLRRGEFEVAERHFRNAIQRLTRRNPNPADGEPYYNLGLCLRYQGRDDEAYDALYKATWNQAWAGPAFHALAELDCVFGRFEAAAEHLDRALRLNADNQRAANLQAIVLRKLGRDQAAAEWLQRTLQVDPLDWWARHLKGETVACDLQTTLDLAHDYVRAGCLDEAAGLLAKAVIRADAAHNNDLPRQDWGAGPLVHYTLGWIEQKRGKAAAARRQFQSAKKVAPDYCFPSRLEEIAVLEAAMESNPKDARAPYYLGNLLYDRRRHQEAITLWERSARLVPSFSIVWRNLGIGYFNVLEQPRKARQAYDRAIKANPGDGRLVYERDQLWKRLGEKPERRLRELEKRMKFVRLRDDLSVELCALYNQTGQHRKALALVSSRNFQPWEGGEGGPLGQWVRSHLALGREALRKAEVQNPKSETRIECLNAAVAHFEAAMTAPFNLGEAKHLLANQSDIHYWLGCALSAIGDPASAKQHWLAAARFKGDFQEMSVRAFSEMTYYSALAWQRLGQQARGAKLLKELLAYSTALGKSPAKIDYFATSLPTLLLFDDNLQFRQETTALFLRAQALLGLKRKAAATRLLKTVLQRDPNHPLASDLLNG